jgi:hypothetical protein
VSALASKKARAFLTAVRLQSMTATSLVGVGGTPCCHGSA